MPGVGNQTPNPAPSVLPGGTTVYPMYNPNGQLNTEKIAQQYMEEYKILLEQEKVWKSQDDQAQRILEEEEFEKYMKSLEKHKEKSANTFLDTLKKFWT